MKKTHHVDENGYYGSFGGAYIPEMLFPNTEELRTQYLDIMGSESFKKEFDYLLRDYVGRPTPLYFAERLSALPPAQDQRLVNLQTLGHVFCVC